MNRRQLFTRLSAIALAPLVKWMPKPDHPQYVIGADVAGERLTWVVFSDSTAEAAFARFNQPVPQEKA